MTARGAAASAAGWVWDRYCVVAVWSVVLEIAVLRVVGGGHFDPAAVAWGLAVVACLRVASWADEFRRARREVQQLVIGLTPQAHADLVRQAEEAGCPTATELVRQSLALHRYVLDNLDGELLTRPLPDDTIVQQLILGDGRRGRRSHHDGPALAASTP